MFMAIAVLAIGVAVAWNLAPTLLRFAAVPSKLGVSLSGLVVLSLAHSVTTCAAGAFGFLAVLGLRETIAAILGRVRFHRISAALQAALIVALVTAVLLLPGVFARGAAREWLAQGGLRSKAIPPLWFVGLHETLAGWVIDALPRTHPSWFPEPLVVAERDATDLYRSFWPRYQQLASISVTALAAIGVITTVACLWNSRRLPVPIVSRPRKDGAVSRAWNWIVAHVVARTSLRQAGFLFTLQILSRRVSHRVVMASSLAVGLSLILVTVPGWVVVPGRDVGDVASVPLALLAGQSLLLASVLGGFRQAACIPADLQASSTFSLAWLGDRTPYLCGVRLAGWIALVVPTLGALFVWHTMLLGIRLATLHLGVGAVVSVLLLEALFACSRLVPFVSGYVRSGELRSAGAICAAAVLALSFALAWLERFALRAPLGYLMLVAAIIGVSVAVRGFDRASRQPAGPLNVDEPPALPTLRLKLSE